MTRMTVRRASNRDDAAAEGRGRYGEQLFSPTASEHDRLRAVELMCDDATITTLETVGVRSHWRCLEIGAGAGSIARWLADAVPAGHVTATDVDPRMIRGGARSNLRITQHDIVRDDLPSAAFHLIHARFVLAHLPARDAVVRRLVDALRAPGVLVIEGFSWNNPSSSDPSFATAMAAYDALSATVIGTDSAWSDRLPRVLEQVGLVDIASVRHRTTAVVRGGLSVAQMWRGTLAAAREPAVALGLAGDDDFARAIALLDDPSFTATGPTMVSAWGSRA